MAQAQDAPFAAAVVGKGVEQGLDLAVPVEVVDDQVRKGQNAVFPEPPLPGLGAPVSFPGQVLGPGFVAPELRALGVQDDELGALDPVSVRDAGGREA